MDTNEIEETEVVQSTPKENDKKSQILAQSFRGPLPPPEVLAEYEKAHTGSIERIFQMAEKEQNHRIESEKYLIQSPMKLSGRGQIFGFIIAILGVGVSYLLISQGSTITGSVFGGSVLLGLVSVFVYGQKNQNKSLEESSEEE